MYSPTKLSFQAMKNLSDKQVSMDGIFEYIESKYPRYGQKEWKNLIFETLLTKKFFQLRFFATRRIKKII